MIVETMTSSADDVVNVPRLYQNGIKDLKCFDAAAAGRGSDNASANIKDLGPAEESGAGTKPGYELNSR